MSALNEASTHSLKRIDLAEQVGLSASGVTRMLLPMEKIGLISKEEGARDARVSLVQALATLINASYSLTATVGRLTRSTSCSDSRTGTRPLNAARYDSFSSTAVPCTQETSSQAVRQAGRQAGRGPTWLGGWSPQAGGTGGRLAKPPP